MNKVIAALILFLLSGNALAMSGTTVGGHVACLVESLLDDVTSFVTAGAEGRMPAVILSRQITDDRHLWGSVSPNFPVPKGN